MSTSTSPTRSTNVSDDEQASQPQKNYSFTRWKKAELLDLCNKLKLNDVPTNAKKNDLIEFLENYLYALHEPLETEVEYPELKTFFESFIDSSADASLKSEGENDAGNSTVSSIANEAGKKYYNFLNFSKVDEEGNAANFKFDLQDRLTDIVESTKKLNENVQDFFSSLITITVIFSIIEFLLLIQNYFQGKQDYNIFIIVGLWLTTNNLIPILFSYYFNFIRYDLLIEIDPMMLNITKGLVYLLLVHSSGKTADTNHILDNFANKSKYCDCEQALLKYVNIMNNGLGNVPFIFSVVGAIITLYVL